jgi:hypothetical protein
VLTDQHHARYTDDEARTAVENIYLPLSGGTLTGLLSADGGLGIDAGGIPTGGAELWHVTWSGTTGRLYRNDWYTGPYLPLVGGTLTGDLTIGEGTVDTRLIVSGGGSSIASATSFMKSAGWYRGYGYFLQETEYGNAWFIGSEYQDDGNHMSVSFGLELGDGDVDTRNYVSLLHFYGATGDVKVGSTPRDGSQVRNVSHGTGGPPGDWQQGDIHLEYA